MSSDLANWVQMRTMTVTTIHFDHDVELEARPRGGEAFLALAISIGRIGLSWNAGAASSWTLLYEFPRIGPIFVFEPLRLM